MEPKEKKHIYKARSEEVQEILSRPPVWIVRWGSGIALCFLIILLGVGWLVPSPTTVQANLKITRPSSTLSLVEAGNDTEFVAVAKLGQNNFGKIQVGQKVSIKLNAYNARDFGVLNGKIVWLSDKFDEEGGYFDAYISLPKNRKTSRGHPVQYLPAMLGQADIVISERKLIQKLSPF